MATYAFSDLHGHLDIYHQIKEYVKPEDKLYCLGDCGDRGPDPWLTVKAVATDPQITYLKGNHEDMLVRAAREALDPDDWVTDDQYVLAINGGQPTLEGLMVEENPSRWIAYLSRLPLYITYTNTQGQEIFLSHAGTSLWKDEEPDITYDLLWGRFHFCDNAKLLSDKIVVHGHTSIKHIAKEIAVLPPKGALKYADGKKYCIDAGTYRNHRAILFNLDTFESKVFKTKEN